MSLCQSGHTPWNTLPFVNVLPKVCDLHHSLLQLRAAWAGSLLTGAWTRQSCILCVCFQGLYIYRHYLEFHWPFWQVSSTYFILSFGAPVSSSNKLLSKQNSSSSDLAIEFLNLDVKFYIYLCCMSFGRFSLLLWSVKIMLNYDCAFSILVLPPCPGSAAVIVRASDRG